MKNYNYTEISAAIIQKQQSSIGGFYLQKDIHNAIDNYRKYPQDAVIKSDLSQICKACGLDEAEVLKIASLKSRSECDQAQKEYFTQHGILQKKSELRSRLFKLLHSIYENSPSSEDYMERIVRRLAPEYPETLPVRTVILRKFITSTDTAFDRSSCTDDIRLGPVINEIIGRMNAADQKYVASRFKSDTEKRKFIADHADDTLFKDYLDSVPFEYRHKLSAVDMLNIISKLIVHCENDKSIQAFPGDIELSDACRSSFEDILQTYGIPQSGTVLQQICALSRMSGEISYSELNSALNPIMEELRQSFRFLLSRTERKYTKGPKKGKTTDSAELLRNNIHDAEDDKNSWKVLEICDDLAAGRFRTARTRERLYYFAYIFEMTVSSLQEQEDNYTDIVKNLFHDYYTYNVLKVLRSAPSADHPDFIETSIEKMPTGASINWKNFAECIYIYYLYHTEFGNPGRRLILAKEMIRRCAEHASKTDPQEKPATGTEVYEKNFKNRILNADPEELENILIREWKINAADRKSGQSRLEIRSEQRTAMKNAIVMIDDVEEMLGYTSFEVREEQISRKKAKEEHKESSDDEDPYNDDIRFRWNDPSLIHKDYSADTDFLKVIDTMKNLLDHLPVWYGKVDRHRMLCVLSYLATAEASFGGNPNRPTLRNHLNAAEFSVDGKKIENSRFLFSSYKEVGAALETLKKIGFEICVVQEPNRGAETDSDHYMLKPAEYRKEPDMNTLIQHVSRTDYVYNKEDDELLNKLIQKKIYSSSIDYRMTRIQYIALFSNSYYYNYDTDHKGRNLPDFYNDYKHQLNKELRKTRYQEFSEKNIFDLYIFIFLFLHCFNNKLRID